MSVFISYRRSASKHLARLLFQALRQRGYDVFLDVTAIDNGAFDNIILNQIAARPHFILILSPGSLERCSQPGDWLYREIEEAFRLGRNIVPIYDDGFNIDAEKGFLPEPLRTELPRINAPPYSFYYFDSFVDTLCNRFLKSVPSNISLASVPATELSEVERRIQQSVQILDTQPNPPSKSIPSPTESTPLKASAFRIPWVYPAAALLGGVAVYLDTYRTVMELRSVPDPVPFAALWGIAFAILLWMGVAVIRSALGYSVVHSTKPFVVYVVTVAFAVIVDVFATGYAWSRELFDILLLWFVMPMFLGGITWLVIWLFGRLRKPKLAPY